MTIIDNLLRLRKKIEQAEEEVIKTNAKRDTYYEQLAVEFEVDTLEDAKKLLEKYKTKLESSNIKLKKHATKLEKLNEL